jgi:hypothetical protein
MMRKRENPPKGAKILTKLDYLKIKFLTGDFDEYKKLFEHYNWASIEREYRVLLTIGKNAFSDQRGYPIKKETKRMCGILEIPHEIVDVRWISRKDAERHWNAGNAKMFEIDDFFMIFILEDLYKKSKAKDERVAWDFERTFAHEIAHIWASTITRDETHEDDHNRAFGEAIAKLGYYPEKQINKGWLFEEEEYF